MLIFLHAVNIITQTLKAEKQSLLDKPTDGERLCGNIKHTQKSGTE